MQNGSSIDYEKYRVFIVALACLQAFFASGIFYGWASLYVVFLDSGVYSNLCPIPNIICDAQKTQLEAIYTWASSVNLIAQLFWGFILDRFGPRICCCISTFLVLLGFILMAFSSPVFDCYLYATVLIAGAGPGVQIALFHLSVLFPESEATVLSIITGAFQLGFFVFLAFKFLNSLGFSLRFLLFCYCIPLVVLLFLGMALWPDAPLSVKFEEDVEGEGEGELKFEADTVYSLTTIPPPLPPLSPRERERLENDEDTPLLRGRQRHRSSIFLDPSKKFNPVDITLRHQVFSLSFFCLLLWMSICIFWANFFIGSVVEQLWIKTKEDHNLTRHYSDIFSGILPIGIIGIPLFGFITDRCGFPSGILLTSTTGVLFACFAVSSDLSYQIQTFIMYSFFRTFIFSTMFAYIAYEFGYRYFGILSGIVLCVGGLAQFIQYPVRKSGASWDEVNIIQLICICATIPYACYVRKREAMKQRQMEENNESEKEEWEHDDFQAE